MIKLRKTQKKRGITMTTRKKKVAILLGAVMILLLSGCSSRWRELNLTTSELDTIKEVKDSLLTAIVEKDESYFQSALSQEALDTPDIDEGIEYMHELLSKSEIESIEEGPTPIRKDYERGKTNKKCRATYHIFMSDGMEYNLTFEYYYEYENRESILGVNRIELLDQSVIDSDPDYDSEKFYGRSGIYNPKWDEETTDESVLDSDTK